MTHLHQPHPPSRWTSALRTALSGAVALIAVASVFASTASAVPTARASARSATTTTARTSAASAATDSRRADFRSPSHNIHCAIFRGGGYNEARCDIAKHSFTPPPKPASCHFDWGFSVKVSVRAHWNCVSDAVNPSPRVPTLAYGHSRTVGHIRCTSRTTAMVCRNLNSGHGFKLSRAAVTLF